MPFSLSWLKLLKYGLPVLIVLGALGWAGAALIARGENNVQLKWDADVAARQKKIDALKQRIIDDEKAHRLATDEIEDKLFAAQIGFQKRITDLRTVHAGELRKSEGRSSIYISLSEAGATQRANLASYASQLDRSVVEGRHVVGELRETLIQRDQQLNALGDQLEADRKLIGVQ